MSYFNFIYVPIQRTEYLPEQDSVIAPGPESSAAIDLNFSVAANSQYLMMGWL